jgi:DNA-binding XRE family transcriptional regulator
MSMATIDEPEQDIDESNRLKALRYMIAGDNQTVFAKKMGVDVKRWNNFERGKPLSKEIAFLLCRQVAGLTTDWLWRDIWSGMPTVLQEELRTALRAVTDAPSDRGTGTT